MPKHVHGEKRKRSLFSTFLPLVNSSYSITALLLKLTHSLRRKVESKNFLPYKFISLGPNRKVLYQLYGR